MKTVKKSLLIVIAVVLSGGVTYAQTKPTATPTPNRTEQARSGPREVPFNLADYGVDFQPDARLIVVMSALDSAGFDPVPAGKELSVFRARVRKDNAELDPNLRARL